MQSLQPLATGLYEPVENNFELGRLLNVNYFGGSRQLFWRIEALQIAAGVV